MIKHIVFWKLKDEALGATRAENAARIKREAEALVGVVPGIVHLEVGIDFEGSAAAWDVALYSEFACREDLAAYQAHPAHCAIAETIGEMRLDRAVVDYEV